MEEIVDRARERLAGGIRYLIAVSPFLSQSLVHDFDAMQSGLCNLLEADFAMLPGIAVIDREEAQAIWQERVDHPNSLGPTVPLLVEGEFKANSVSGGKKTTFKVQVTCRFPGAKSKSFEANDLANAELPRWLASLPKQLVDQTGQPDQPVPSFDPHEQFVRLTECAESFIKFAEWRHAVELRQAALMLEPNDATNRLRLFARNVRFYKLARILGTPAPIGCPQIANHDSKLCWQSIVTNWPTRSI